VSPRVPKGGTFGTPAGSSDSSSYTLLATPTPGAANSDARPGTGPLIISATTHLAQPPQAGEDIAINATVRSAGKGVSAVELLYRCGLLSGANSAGWLMMASSCQHRELWLEQAEICHA
jgi:hypothetical protein